jgi:HK97 family phage major capsid protein
MREQELIQRADLALSDLVSDGGLMPAETSNRFVRNVMDETTVLQDARRITMRSPKMDINRIGFDSRVLRPADQGTISTPERGETGTRALVRADRAKPTTSKITLETKEVIAEVNLPYEVIEDSIEGGDLDQAQFQQTVLDLLTERVALDLEELILLGDTSSGDSYLALENGIIKQAVSNIVNAGGDPMSPDLFASMIKALPTKYQRRLNQMRIYLAKTKEIDYRMAVAQRQTQLGDSILTGNAPVSALGIPLSPAAYMPSGTMLMTLPQNIILGIQRNMRLEFDKDVRERVIIIVVTMRIAVAFENEDLVVKATNIG